MVSPTPSEKILLVDHWGNCSLVNPKNGIVDWTFESSKNQGIEIYTNRKGGVEDILELKYGRRYGRSIYLYVKGSKCQVKKINEASINKFLKGKLSHTQVDIHVPGKDFTIIKDVYEFRKRGWIYIFPIYKGVYNNGDDCIVAQALDLKSLRRICAMYNVVEFENQTLKDIVLHEDIVYHNRLNIDPSPAVGSGTLNGQEVAVGLIKKRKYFYLQNEKLMKITRLCENVVPFLGASFIEDEEGSKCYILGFPAYNVDLEDFIAVNEPGWDKKWRVYVKNMIVGLRSLEKIDLAHCNLHSTYIKVLRNQRVAIGELIGTRKHLPHGLEAYLFGRVLLRCMSKLKHQFATGDNTVNSAHLTDVSMIDDSLVEAKSIITRLLDPVAGNRPSLSTLEKHIFIWPDKDIMIYLQKISDIFEAKAKAVRKQYKTLIENAETQHTMKVAAAANSQYKVIGLTNAHKAHVASLRNTRAVLVRNEQVALDNCYDFLTKSKAKRKRWDNGIWGALRSAMSNPTWYTAHLLSGLLRLLRNFLHHKEKTLANLKPTNLISQADIKFYCSLSDEEWIKQLQVDFPGLPFDVYEGIEVEVMAKRIQDPYLIMCY